MTKLHLSSVRNNEIRESTEEKLATVIPADLKLVDLDSSEKFESDSSSITSVAAELSIVTELLSSREHALKNGFISGLSDRQTREQNLIAQ